MTSIIMQDNGDGPCFPHRMKEQQHYSIMGSRGPCALFLYSGITACFMLSSLWFLLRPYHDSNVLLSGFIVNGPSGVSHSIANKIKDLSALANVTTAEEAITPPEYNESATQFANENGSGTPPYIDTVKLPVHNNATIPESTAVGDGIIKLPVREYRPELEAATTASNDAVKLPVQENTSHVENITNPGDEIMKLPVYEDTSEVDTSTAAADATALISHENATQVDILSTGGDGTIKLPVYENTSQVEISTIPRDTTIELQDQMSINQVEVNTPPGDYTVKLPVHENTTQFDSSTASGDDKFQLLVKENMTQVHISASPGDDTMQEPHGGGEIPADGNGMVQETIETMQPVNSSLNQAFEAVQNYDAATPSVQTNDAAISSFQTDDASVLQCELWRGEWIVEDRPPLYTNKTCKNLSSLRDCVGNGRPDKDYLYWSWKPSDCEIPRFNASDFLEMQRGKSIAFVGDSLARDQGESLICLLTEIEEPERPGWELKWTFPSYNFTVEFLFSPFLVENTIDQDGVATLHVDLPDKAWKDRVHEFNVAVFSTGYWHFRICMYYENNTFLGASINSEANVTKLEFLAGFRMSMRTALGYLSREYRGIAFARTVTVDHFEYGSWDEGGRCNRTQPYAATDMTVPWRNALMNKIQTEEFEKAQSLVNHGPGKLVLMNVTYSTSMRPDGHPGMYRNQPKDTPKDCLHWCMPGPVDTWNQLLQYMLKPFFKATSKKL
ncbi:hypothetical protein KP509_18G035700 [Ceratopteris richardii]|uniref:Trichome birefringence-like N-terminal domain-containing protein n=1 Tax=Ceratopteris richardii TaxID=49495 RepID=A0A8T2SSE8_CERRI|nr:hypothetical protein KP509_18G035700 [Ceratopteris richardii]